MCVVGTHDLFEHPHINDLAYMPATKNGVFGFNILVGGFFSPKRCAEAIPMDAWVPADDVVPLCKTILETYRDLGTRGNRQKTRMMWLIDEMVLPGFFTLVEILSNATKCPLQHAFVFSDSKLVLRFSGLRIAGM